MKIGIDARLYDEAGNGRYIRNLISHLQILDEEDQYYIFLLKKDFDKLSFKDNFVKVLADIKWYGLREQTQFLRILNQHNLDLMHFPHFNIPIFYRKKFVVTIHDLIHQHFNMERASTHGKLVYTLKKWGYNLTFKNAIRRSEKIITVSNFVKKQLVDEWKVREDKIEVIYEAVEEKLISQAKNAKKSTLNQPYIFYVGNAHPHKNIEGLIEAFLKLKRKYLKLNLVLAGKDHYFWQKIKSKYMDKNVKYLGFVSDEQLAALYKNAVCYVIPSFEEGFGIPLLEAFSCECPVVASSIGALKEIGGEACIYFDPKNTQDLVSQISKLIEDKNFRERLISYGLERYKQFSWEKLAIETKEVYASCISS